MLANTYRGEVPTSPKMMPMALHINTQSCTHKVVTEHQMYIIPSITEVATVLGKVKQGLECVIWAFPSLLHCAYLRQFPS